MMTFRAVSLFASVVCLILAVFWIAIPDMFFWMWQMHSSPEAAAIGQRGGALFMGLAIMLHATRDLPPSPIRRQLGRGMALALGTLVVLGALHYTQGIVGLRIGLAMLVELALAAAFYAATHEP